jgi:inhibitor of KinA sporulation pathway (predicted exonuclease)
MDEANMARLLDQILVIDVEATCWDGAPPPGQEGEIIEIGLCPLDVGTGRRLERRSILVRPERSVVSAFCTGLTTLTQNQVDGGVSFAEACAILRKDYRAPERVWASFGDYDRRQFERQCGSTGVAYPFGPTHVNVKTLFALGRGLPHEVGTAAVLRMAGLPQEGTPHRGHDDAWNIAAILAGLLARLRGPGDAR